MSLQKNISVAMCTYNGEKYLKEQLDSIAAQTRLPSQLVIVDDRSTDSSVEIIRSFALTAPFQVELIVNPVNIGSSSKGITKNFEEATRLCTGAIIVPCDQDDVWVPRKLAVMAAFLEADSTIGAVFSDAQLVTEKGAPKNILLSQTTGLNKSEQRRLARGDALPLILSMTKVYGSSLMFDARLRDKILPVPKHWWFDAWVASMAVVHARLVFTPEQLYFYRIHPNQSVSASLDTLPDRVRRWRSSARDFWLASEGPLKDLYGRIEAEKNPKLQNYLDYLQGRLTLLQFRSELPANHIARAIKILPAAVDYFRYFNGWRSLVKDLTA